MLPAGAAGCVAPTPELSVESGTLVSVELTLDSESFCGDPPFNSASSLGAEFVLGGELALAGEPLLDSGALALLGFESPPLRLDEPQWHKMAMPATNTTERKIVRFIGIR